MTNHNQACNYCGCLQRHLFTIDTYPKPDENNPTVEPTKEHICMDCFKYISPNYSDMWDKPINKGVK